MEKNYDIILFGVTGFTGKLAVEYLLEKAYDVRWAGCARNSAKAEAALQEILDRVNESKDEGQKRSLPPILTADLVVESPEDEQKLSDIVKQTHVVITAAGPFEKYGTTLVKLCAEHGVSYADITGETDFVRLMIQKHDETARKTGACIVNHCGNDCIPQDLLVYEMNQYAIKHESKLDQVITFVQFPDSASLSGGTTATAIYQLGKSRRNQTDKPEFDPLLRDADGSKSVAATKNISPKSSVYEKHVQAKVGPWIMGPVMVNCVRRSNALLHYNENFAYGDAQVKSATWSSWLYEMSLAARIAGAIFVPSIFSRFVPQPGEGPDRQAMEEGYMTLHAKGTMTKNKKSEEGEPAEPIEISGKFHFNKDIGYLYTAALLSETGMVLLAKKKNGTSAGGVLTPAVAMGSELTQRILSTMDTSLEVKEL